MRTIGPVVTLGYIFYVQSVRISGTFWLFVKKTAEKRQLKMTPVQFLDHFAIRQELFTFDFTSEWFIHFSPSLACKRNFGFIWASKYSGSFQGMNSILLPSTFVNDTLLCDNKDLGISLKIYSCFYHCRK